MEPLNPPSEGDRDESGPLRCLRLENGQEREDGLRLAEVEVPVLRGVPDPEVRHDRGALRGVPVVAALEGHPVVDAGRREGLQEEDRGVLAHLADAAADGRAAPGRLRRRHLPGQGPGRPHRLHRRARAVVVHGAGGDLPRLGGAHGADPGLATLNGTIS